MPRRKSRFQFHPSFIYLFIWLDDINDPPRVNFSSLFVSRFLNCPQSMDLDSSSHSGEKGTARNIRVGVPIKGTIFIHIIIRLIFFIHYYFYYRNVGVLTQDKRVG